MVIARVSPVGDLSFVSQQHAGGRHHQNDQAGDDADRQVTPEEYFAELFHLEQILEMLGDVGNQQRYRDYLSKPWRQGAGSRTIMLILSIEGRDQFRFLYRNDDEPKHQDADEPQERNEPVAGHQAQCENLD